MTDHTITIPGLRETMEQAYAAVHAEFVGAIKRREVVLLKSADGKLTGYMGPDRYTDFFDRLLIAQERAGEGCDG